MVSQEQIKEKYVQVTGRSMSGDLVLPKLFIPSGSSVNLGMPKDYHNKKWLSCSRCGNKLFKAYYQEGVLTIICSKCGLDEASE